MSKVRKKRAAAARPTSAVDPAMLAQYRRAARVPSMREDIQALARLNEEYSALVQVGDNFRAMGAAVDLVDAALRLAAIPSPVAEHFLFKAEFLEHFFPSMAKTMHYPHAARVATAALNVERALATHGTSAPH